MSAFVKRQLFLLLLMEKQFETFAKISTYAQRLWDFFQGLFKTSFSKIFDLFGIQEEFQPYLDSITQALKESTPIIRCEA